MAAAVILKNRKIAIVTFQYSLNILSNTCTSRHQQNRGYGILLLCAQFSHGLVNSAMGQIPCSTERISSLKIKWAILRSAFDYLTFWCFRIFSASLLTSYIRMPLMQKHIYRAVKRIYNWSHVLGSGSLMFWGMCGNKGGLCPPFPLVLTPGDY